MSKADIEKELSKPFLFNNVSGVAHNDLEQAFNYYADILESYGYELGISENGVYTIESLNDLCDALNHIDVYGCGSSFEIKNLM